GLSQALAPRGSLRDLSPRRLRRARFARAPRSSGGRRVPSVHPMDERSIALCNCLDLPPEAGRLRGARRSREAYRSPCCLRGATLPSVVATDVCEEEEALFLRV